MPPTIAAFPDEFVDLLSKTSVKAINDFSATQQDIRRQKTFWFPEVVPSRKAASAVRLLEESLGTLMRPVRSRIPKSSISGMRKNYADQLPKTLSNSSIILHEARGQRRKAAHEIGLMQMLQSESLHAVAEKLSGFELWPDPGCQVIRYSEGDYVGPHNDHHPEAPNLRDGYIDFHLTLSNGSVDNQWLVYETDGFLRNTHQVGVPSGMCVSFLPFWHYTTPLVARKNAKNEAHRWLLLTSFSIKRRRPKSPAIRI